MSSTSSQRYVNGGGSGGAFSAGTQVKFDATSSYAQDYDAKELPSREPAVPRSPPKATAKFDGTSSYKVSMLPKPL